MAEEGQIVIRDRELTTPLWDDYPEIVSISPGSRYDLANWFMFMQAEVVPNVPIEFVLNFWDYVTNYGMISFYVYQSDDPACFTDDSATYGSWVFHPSWEMLAVLEKAAFLDGSGTEMELRLTPKVTFTKPYLKIGINNSRTGDHGFFDLTGVYELMDMAIYNRVMKAKRVTEKQIEACDVEVAESDEIKADAQAKKVVLEAESALWNNFLSDEIAAYEAVTGGSQ